MRMLHQVICGCRCGYISAFYPLEIARKSNELGTTKKSKVENNLVIYMKGVQFDFAKEASKRPIEFGRKLSSIVGKVGEVRSVKDSVRITYLKTLNPKQKSVLYMPVPDGLIDR